MDQPFTKESEEPVWESFLSESWAALRQKAYTLLRRRFAYGWPETDCQDMAQEAMIKVCKALILACAHPTVLDTLCAACTDTTVLQALDGACEDPAVLAALHQGGPCPPAFVLLDVIAKTPVERLWPALPAEVHRSVLSVLLKEPHADQALIMAHFDRWFTRVVENVARDWKRTRHGRSDTRREIALAETTEDPRQAEELSQMACHHDFRMALKEGLEAMPEPGRTIARDSLPLRGVAGCSSGEIEHILGVNANTIRAAWAAALPLLRLYFEKE